MFVTVVHHMSSTHYLVMYFVIVDQITPMYVCNELFTSCTPYVIYTLPCDVFCNCRSEYTHVCLLFLKYSLKVSVVSAYSRHVAIVVSLFDIHVDL